MRIIGFRWFHWQTGRLVNIANFSVHTISSVVKKFLRKLPQGVFGADAERRLFDVVLSDAGGELAWKQEQVRRWLPSLFLSFLFQPPPRWSSFGKVC